MRGRHSTLAEVAGAYSESRNRYELAQHRGDTERADQALADMQEIERCVTVVENNIAWRATLASRRGGGMR